MIIDQKFWVISYDHDDERKGKVLVKTELHALPEKENQYGKPVCGRLIIGDWDKLYDLRYEKGDLHSIMIKDWFGKGLVDIQEIKEGV